VVRDRRQDSATHRLRRSAQEVRSLSRTRQEMEAGLKVLPSPRSLAAWQVGYRRRGTEVSRSRSSAPEHHMARCLVASLMVERERLNQGEPWRQCQPRLILKGQQVPLPALERGRKAA
jgi:hypothetical protein